MSSAAVSKLEPFRYGWRYVRKRVNGKVKLIEQPLTLEDVLHPKEGDCIPEATAQEKDRRYLADVFDYQLADDPTALVLSDCLVDLGVLGIKPISPDVSVFSGYRGPRQRNWGTFRVLREKARLVMATEVTSPDTRRNDVIIKLDYYHRGRVSYYVVVDRIDDEGPPTLTVYRYTKQRYVSMRPDRHGRFLLKPVKLRLGVKENRVVCYDAATGKELGDYAQAARDLKATERRAQRAENRVAELEAELRRLRREV